MKHVAPRAATEARALALVEHLDWFRLPPGACAAERAIRVLVPTRSTRKQLELFEFKVPHGTVRNWRCGARRVPEWAREIIKEKLRARRAELDRLIAEFD